MATALIAAVMSALRLDVAEELAGRHVILVDDIIDTGLTLEAVCCMLQQHKPASIKTAVMCDKADRRVNGKVRIM